MFDKVVTPSDVGKLNRLVIPKQHAEKYFPLDASANDKGLLLSFEDRSGKPWRFRYSYWNSSQSYVMTKGWSRFVKEKRLDAGDTVSFGRGVGEHARGRLFIDWRRRPDPPAPYYRLPLSSSSSVPFAPWAAHHHYPAAAGGIGGPIGRTAALHLPPSSSLCYDDSHHHHHRGAHVVDAYGPSSRQLLFYRPHHQQVVLESVPVMIPPAEPPSSGSSKRLRLFGVNLDCAAGSEDEKGILSAPPPHQLPSPPSSSSSSSGKARQVNFGLAFQAAKL
ncbi:hypothetical protein PR202_gb18398 [Eleusine coracana subsp. coracana]|uniref:TF-B3 domain-containing protein n=1 Tax=Eleusine coracana subsp. coracana TaxID=191504 RepID=A0AAV5F372_ELECO|nr:hypothetical protein PR202_gb18398 [Eleusine coracana subsp. coracana]